MDNYSNNDFQVQRQKEARLEKVTNLEFLDESVFVKVNVSKVRFDTRKELLMVVGEYIVKYGGMKNKLVVVNGI